MRITKTASPKISLRRLGNLIHSAARRQNNMNWPEWCLSDAMAQLFRHMKLFEIQHEDEGVCEEELARKTVSADRGILSAVNHGDK